jgi:RecA/RadA recombinase
MVKKEKTKSTMPSFFSKMLAEMECATLASEVSSEMDKLPLGDPSLDYILGGGLAVNRLNIFAGQSGSGKTFLCAKAAAMLQQHRPDAWVVIFDMEYYYKDQPDRVARLGLMGLDLTKTMIISSNQPNVVFEKLDEMESEMKAGQVDICAVIGDSLGGLEDKHSADKFSSGEVEDAANKYGGMGKFIGALVRKLVRIAAENRCTILLVQHAIEDLAAAGKGIKKYIVTGGQKLRLLCDAMLLSETVERKDALLTADNNSVEYGDKNVVASGKTIRFKCLKSRYCVEGRVAEVKINFDTCEIVRVEDSIISLAKLVGVLVHPVNPDTGAVNTRWWQFAGMDEKYNGEKQVLEALKDKALFTKVLDLCNQSSGSLALSLEVE